MKYFYVQLKYFHVQLFGLFLTLFVFASRRQTLVNYSFKLSFGLFALWLGSSLIGRSDILSSSPLVPFHFHLFVIFSSSDFNILLIFSSSFHHLTSIFWQIGNCETENLSDRALTFLPSFQSINFLIFVPLLIFIFVFVFVFPPEYSIN